MILRDESTKLRVVQKAALTNNIKLLLTGLPDFQIHTKPQHDREQALYESVDPAAVQEQEIKDKNVDKDTKLSISSPCAL